MSRLFVRSAATDYINLGDITAAHFVTLTTWSILGFFRQNTSDASNESMIISKEAGSATRTLRIRINNGTAPQEPEIYVNGSEAITGPDTVQLDTWYMFALTNDGAGGASGLKFYLATMDGVFDSNFNPATGQMADDSGPVTADILIGRIAGDASNPDWWDGDIAHIAYFDSEFSSDKILDFLRFPDWVVMAEGSNCVFYLPIGFGSPEQDLSGHQNNGTLNGTPAISMMPPTALFVAGWPTVPLIEEAAGGATIPIMAHNYRMRRVGN